MVIFTDPMYNTLPVSTRRANTSYFLKPNVALVLTVPVMSPLSALSVRPEGKAVSRSHCLNPFAVGLILTV